MRHASAVDATMELDQPVVPHVGRRGPGAADLDFLGREVGPEGPVVMADGALAFVERLFGSREGDLDGFAMAG